MPRCPAWTFTLMLAVLVLYGTSSLALQAESPLPGAPTAPAGRILTSGQVLPGPVGDDYVLGPGDQLSVTVHTRTPRVYDCPITPTGHIAIEQLAPLQVAGLSLADARARITKALDELYLHVEVTVTVTRLRTFRVWLLGEVKQAEVYIVDPLTTVSDRQAIRTVQDLASIVQSVAGIYFLFRSFR